MDVNEKLIKVSSIMELKEMLLKTLTFKKILLYILVGVIIIMLASPIENIFSKEEKNIQNSAVNYNGTSNEIKNSGNSYNYNYSNDYVTFLENELRECLLKVRGVGEVDVMITVKDTGEKYIYNDTEISKTTTKEADTSGTTREITTFDEKKSAIYKDDEPYLIKEELPQICGVLIISEGGDDPHIVSEINDAIMALFGIESNKIKVMKHN